ncbi:MAG: tetratricopeptide repeat protein [Chthoniobacterales bacterium]|nr:tetratricopeptide repeat protein [Chthoniobacterales bacterium]
MPTVSQISSDPALETSLFWDQYKVPIIALAAVLVLGGLGFAGYEVLAQRRAAEAASALASATTPEDYQRVIDGYAGSAPAASAYLLLAEQQRAKKNYADANLTLHKFIDQFPKHELITTAWMGVAANLDSLGKSSEALSTYQRLVAEYPQSFNAPLALLAEVPLLKASGKIEDARRACESIISQYRDSVVMSEAIRELQKLPKATAPITPPKPQPSATKK